MIKPSNDIETNLNCSDLEGRTANGDGHLWNKKVTVEALLNLLEITMS